jgi:hypothetical protein
MSVMVPPVQPFTWTVTPGKPKPSSLEITLPVTMRFCAHDVKGNSKVIRKRKSKHLLFIHKKFVSLLPHFKVLTNKYRNKNKKSR